MNILAIISPWLIVLIYHWCSRKFFKNSKIVQSEILGYGIWNSLTLWTGVFAIAVIVLAQNTFNFTFIPTYLLTISAIALLTLILQLIYFKEIIWQDYFKIYFRSVLVITLLLQIFFTITYIIKLV